MYSFFFVVEFAGRTLGSTVQYLINIPNKKKHGFAFIVYNAEYFFNYEDGRFIFSADWPDIAKS